MLLCNEFIILLKGIKKYFKFFPVLIYDMVSTDRYKPSKQKRGLKIKSLEPVF